MSDDLSREDVSTKLVWTPFRSGFRANTGRKGYFVIEPTGDGQYSIWLRGRKIGQQYADIEDAKALAEDQLAVMVAHERGGARMIDVAPIMCRKERPSALSFPAGDSHNSAFRERPRRDGS
jgi:hypothetical protein